MHKLFMIFITEKTKITEESLTVSYQSALIENLRLKILFLLSTLVTHAFFNLTKFLFYSSRGCLIWDFHSDLIWVHSKSASYFDKLMVASVDFRQTNSWNSLPSAPLRGADGSYNSPLTLVENRPRVCVWEVTSQWFSSMNLSNRRRDRIEWESVPINRSRS